MWVFELKLVVNEWMNESWWINEWKDGKLILYKNKKNLVYLVKVWF